MAELDSFGSTSMTPPFPILIAPNAFNAPIAELSSSGSSIRLSFSPAIVCSGWTFSQSNILSSGSFSSAYLIPNSVRKTPFVTSSSTCSIIPFACSQPIAIDAWDSLSPVFSQIFPSETLGESKKVWRTFISNGCIPSSIFLVSVIILSESIFKQQ